jgi:hypothetical protein
MTYIAHMAYLTSPENTGELFTSISAFWLVVRQIILTGRF